MFVSWKRRMWCSGWGGKGEWVKTAELVEFARTDGGLRHTHICCLGSVREGQETAQRERVHFWESVERNLANAGVEGQERRVIERMLQIAVPNPRTRSWRRLIGSGATPQSDQAENITGRAPRGSTAGLVPAHRSRECGDRSVNR
jgi:hypothetical protein